MSLEQLRDYLQGYYGRPIVLRKLGTTVVKCPYCGQYHYHEQAGRQIAACDEAIRFTIGLVIGDRSFVPNWGYDILEYAEGANGINELFY